MTTATTTATVTVSTDIIKIPNIIKFTALLLVFLSLLFLTHHLFFSTTTPTVTTTTFSFPLELQPNVSTSRSNSRLPVPAVVRTGIVDETGAMTWEFEVGEFFGAVEELNDLVGDNGNDDDVKEENSKEKKGVVRKFAVCEERMKNYVPCFDNDQEKHERDCPAKGLDCFMPVPEAYKTPVTWPKSRDEVWFSNVADESGENHIKVKEDKFIFPGSETQFPNGVDDFLNRISEMAPEISFGNHTRVALDVDCRVGSFGAYMMQRNVTTLSILWKDVHENGIQIALERGVPAMVALFATRRLLYPSQAFDLIHCSRCRINWIREDGILLLEANRILRAGGYFAWVPESVYKDGEVFLEKWKEMEDLTSRICWELVKKEGNITLWRKPLNNTCYVNRDAGVLPPICDYNDDPDNVWYVDLSACIMWLPEDGYRANLSTWPARLHQPPNRLQSIKMDADISRKEIFRAESKYWNDIVDSYVHAFRWKEMSLRNVMDMRAGFGGFAAALHDLQIDCWVMNVVPVSGFNTLPVIYDRGLIGVIHDWCEPFDTYPRTYDLLHAAGLFSVEQKRCNISTIMLEMNRMLRPGGHVYIRDSVSIMDELQEIANAMGWVQSKHDTGEGPYASWKILICEKRM